MIAPDNRLSTATAYEYVSCCLALLAMLMILTVHLLPALIAGLLVYELCTCWRRSSPDTSRVRAPGGWLSAWWYYWYSAR